MEKKSCKKNQIWRDGRFLFYAFGGFFLLAIVALKVEEKWFPTKLDLRLGVACREDGREDDKDKNPFPPIVHLAFGGFAPNIEIESTIQIEVDEAIREIESHNMA